MSYPDVDTVGALSEAIEASDGFPQVGTTTFGIRVIEQLLRRGYVIAAVNIPVDNVFDQAVQPADSRGAFRG